MADEDDRYRRVLEEFGKFHREFQDYKLTREQALNDLERRIVAQIQLYWQATAAALRQMSDWSATHEDTARRERTEERAKRAWQAWTIIGLLLLLIVGGCWRRRNARIA